MVQWRAIDGFPGYEVSDVGEVRRGVKVLGTVLDRKGYRFVTMHGPTGPVKRPIARLVAAAFIGPRPDGQVVRHRDGNKARNVPSNLVYGTQQQNEADKRAHGTAPIGVNHPAAKLTERQVREIRSRYRRMSQTEGTPALGREYGVSAHLISMIVRGKLWAHLS